MLVNDVDKELEKNSLKNWVNNLRTFFATNGIETDSKELSQLEFNNLLLKILAFGSDIKKEYI